MTEADAYRCPSCGAPADPKSSKCAYCGAALSPVRCPWCFGWLDAKSGDCPRCGSVERPPAAGAKPLTCPTCRSGGLDARERGGVVLSACARCGGIWSDPQSFKTLCDDRKVQSVYLGQGELAPKPETFDPTSSPMFYRPCAACGEMMNRVNFGKSSGVIIDVCKPHGIWFDMDELRRIVLFIQSGGPERQQELEKQELDDERRRLEAARGDILPPPDLQQPHPITAARLLGDLFF